MRYQSFTIDTPLTRKDNHKMVFYYATSQNMIENYMIS